MSYMKAWKQGTWSNYWRNLSESRGDRRFNAEMEAFLHNYDKPMCGMPIFHKAYYNVPESFNNGQNEDDDDLLFNDNDPWDDDEDEM